MAPELLAAAAQLTEAGQSAGNSHDLTDVWPAGQHDDKNTFRSFQIGFVSTLFGEEVRAVSPRRSLRTEHVCLDFGWRLEICVECRAEFCPHIHDQGRRIFIECSVSGQRRRRHVQLNLLTHLIEACV